MAPASLKPGDVVEHADSGFRWVVLRSEPAGRVLQWSPVPSGADLTRAPLTPRWSPPYSAEEWERPMENVVAVSAWKASRCL